MRPVLIAELGRIVNPILGQKVLALLSAYIDASLANQPPRVTVVAGYIAAQNEWDHLEDKWQNGLAEWGLQRFHLAELSRQLGAERAALCEKYFSNIIECLRLSAVAAALINVDWEKPDWGCNETFRLSSPYEQCLDFALKVVGDFTNEVFPSEPVAIICCLDDTATNINAAFQRRQKQYPQFVSISCGISKVFVPLQCADLGAGILRRSWTAIAKGDPEAEDIPWGEMPRGAGTQQRNSFWSLRQGAVIVRALAVHEKRQAQGTPEAQLERSSKEAQGNRDELFRGDYVLGSEYQEGEHVHYAGCAWIVRQSTSSVLEVPIGYSLEDFPVDDEVGRCYLARWCFGGTTRFKACSNASPLSSTPSFRAISMNRSDCSALVIFRFGGGFRFGFSAIPVWSLKQSFDR